MISVLVFVLLGSVCVDAQKRYVCYNSDQDPYLQFGTKTAYEFSGGRPISRNEQRIPGCKAMQVWMVGRHGTRNPSKTELERFDSIIKLRDEIIRNHVELKTSQMCSMDMTNLQNWKLIWKPEDEEQLTQQGREEMRLLAKRLQTRFPDLILQRPYTEQAYTFRHTDTALTRSSAEAFAEGLLSAGTPARCMAWQTQVDDNTEILAQMDKYLASPELENLASNISIRLGFKYNLNIESFLYAYDLCRYEKAARIRQTSAWCALFTTDELKTIEYAEDLRYYYNSGYGSRMNAKVGCTLLKDMMTRFRRLAVGAPEPAGVFYFTHQTALLTLLARMDLFNDASPLTANDFPYQSKRLWRTSYISPFAANLQAVFLNCSSLLPRGGSEFKVAFYLQESFVPIKGCEVGLCSWNYLKEKYLQLAEDCNIERICSGADGAAQLQISITAFVASLLFIYFQGK
ncbi:hypothetical protein B566_EDAN013503 [Ephemera danica]|nr:hypothetical protein B566_EDAN013503 [Ephemera danica]